MSKSDILFESDAESRSKRMVQISDLSPPSVSDFLFLREGFVLRRDLVKTAWVEKVGRGRWAVKCNLEVIGGHMEYTGKDFKTESEALSHFREMFSS